MLEPSLMTFQIFEVITNIDWYDLDDLLDIKVEFISVKGPCLLFTL